MIKFIILLVAVFVVVDLFVRFILEPLVLSYYKKDKEPKSAKSKLDPNLKLATETMYDGGKPHVSEKSNDAADSENITEDEVKS